MKTTADKKLEDAKENIKLAVIKMEILKKKIVAKKGA